ncbi:MAG: hypothetical protein WCC57_05530 [Paracoccaceae bacterium]
MIFDPLLDLFRGRAITIPPLDGAFRANTALDTAPMHLALPAADNLVAWQGKMLASSGTDLVNTGTATVIQHCAAPISALAVSPAGDLAVAQDTGALTIAGANITLPAGLGCITALAFAPDGALWLANGSATHRPSEWAADLMEKNASGSVWRQASPGQKFEKIAAGLAFPYGLLPQGDGVIVSESWRHQLIRLTANGVASPVLRHLPGYPARLTATPDGGAWLAMFAPRNRLIEFVLKEHHYRQDMMASVPRDHWIAPALASGRSFIEPMQCGGIHSMGVHKAWAPSRSFGLVVRLDANMVPLHSLHSRADGKRHGVCSVLETAGQVFIACKGGDCVVVADAAAAGGA